jgi:CheY-like chemotaxis protein
MASSKVPYILYAEDDPDDQEMFRQLAEQVSDHVEPLVFGNGLALLEYLEDLATDDQIPTCVVLDIKMPMFDGITTLKTIRNDERYLKLPVVIFTNSSEVDERDRCLGLGANAFLTKPLHHDDLQTLATELSHYLQ